MRGRPNDPVKARAKARKHAQYAHYCSCGKVSYGNEGWASHVAMHERRGEWRTKFSTMTADQHRAEFSPDARGRGAAPEGPLAAPQTHATPTIRTPSKGELRKRLDDAEEMLNHHEGRGDAADDVLRTLRRARDDAWRALFKAGA